MKNKTLNKKVLRAMSIGLATMMATTSMPLNVLADDDIEGGADSSEDAVKEVKAEEVAPATPSQPIVVVHEEVSQATDASVKSTNTVTATGVQEQFGENANLTPGVTGGEADALKAIAIQVYKDAEALKAVGSVAEADELSDGVLAELKEDAAVDTAKEELDDALAALQNTLVAEDSEEEDEEEINTVSSASENTVDLVDETEKSLLDKQQAIRGAGTISVANAAYNEAVALYDEAAEEVEDRKADMETATEAYEKAEKVYQEKLAAYNSAIDKNAENTAKALNDLKDAEAKANALAEEAETAKKAYEAAQEGLSSTATEAARKIIANHEKIENENLKPSDATQEEYKKVNDDIFALILDNYYLKEVEAGKYGDDAEFSSVKKVKHHTTEAYKVRSKKFYDENGEIQYESLNKYGQYHKGTTMYHELEYFETEVTYTNATGEKVTETLRYEYKIENGKLVIFEKNETTLYTDGLDNENYAAADRYVVKTADGKDGIIYTSESIENVVNQLNDGTIKKDADGTYYHIAGKDTDNSTDYDGFTDAGTTTDNKANGTTTTTISYSDIADGETTYAIGKINGEKKIVGTTEGTYTKTTVITDVTIETGAVNDNYTNVPGDTNSETDTSKSEARSISSESSFTSLAEAKKDAADKITNAVKDAKTSIDAEEEAAIEYAGGAHVETERAERNNGTVNDTIVGDDYNFTRTLVTYEETLFDVVDRTAEVTKEAADENITYTASQTAQADIYYVPTFKATIDISGMTFTDDNLFKNYNVDDAKSELEKAIKKKIEDNETFKNSNIEYNFDVTKTKDNDKNLKQTGAEYKANGTVTVTFALSSIKDHDYDYTLFGDIIKGISGEDAAKKYLEQKYGKEQEYVADGWFCTNDYAEYNKVFKATGDETTVTWNADTESAKDAKAVAKASAESKAKEAAAEMAQAYASQFGLGDKVTVNVADQGIRLIEKDTAYKSGVVTYSYDGSYKIKTTTTVTEENSVRTARQETTTTTVKSTTNEGGTLTKQDVYNANVMTAEYKRTLYLNDNYWNGNENNFKEETDAGFAQWLQKGYDYNALGELAKHFEQVESEAKKAAEDVAKAKEEVLKLGRELGSLKAGAMILDREKKALDLEYAEAVANYNAALEKFEGLKNLLDELNADRQRRVNQLTPVDEASEDSTELTGPAPFFAAGMTINTPVAIPIGGIPESGVAGARTGVGSGNAGRIEDGEIEDLGGLIEDTDVDDKNPVAITDNVIKSIKDEAVPLAPIGEESAKKMNWWWLLLIAALGATGEEMYRRNKMKKEEAAIKKDSNK